LITAETKASLEDLSHLQVKQMNTCAVYLLIGYSTITGIYAGIANVFSKMLVEAIIMNQKVNTSVTNFQLGIVSLFLAFFLYFNIVQLNNTLAMFSQLKVIPAY